MTHDYNKLNKLAAEKVMGWRCEMKELKVIETDIMDIPIYQVEVPADATIRIMFTEPNLVSPFTVNKEVRKEYLEMKEDIDKAVAEERERCAKIAEELEWFDDTTGYYKSKESIAAAIRKGK